MTRAKRYAQERSIYMMLMLRALTNRPMTEHELMRASHLVSRANFCVNLRKLIAWGDIDERIHLGINVDNQYTYALTVQGHQRILHGQGERFVSVDGREQHEGRLIPINAYRRHHAESSR